MTQLRIGGWTPTAEDTPFDRLGGESGITALVDRFYDAMERHEPALARLHAVDESGRVSSTSRARFALFLVGWLGGPQTYTERMGHPRLRMRHGKVPVDEAMRDAWLRSMGVALNESNVDAEVRGFLDARFAEVADFLRNVADSAPLDRPGLGDTRR